MLLSSSGEYKPFDKDSDGLILGEACSCVILENRKKADDDFEIVSYSNSFDNYSITSSNPNAIATFNCLNQALQNANLVTLLVNRGKFFKLYSYNVNFDLSKGLRLCKFELSLNINRIYNEKVNILHFVNHRDILM